MAWMGLIGIARTVGVCKNAGDLLALPTDTYDIGQALVVLIGIASIRIVWERSCSEVAEVRWKGKEGLFNAVGCGGAG